MHVEMPMEEENAATHLAEHPPYPARKSKILHSSSIGDRRGSISNSNRSMNGIVDMDRDRDGNNINMHCILCNQAMQAQRLRVGAWPRAWTRSHWPPLGPQVGASWNHRNLCLTMAESPQATPRASQGSLLRIIVAFVLLSKGENSAPVYVCGSIIFKVLGGKGAQGSPSPSPKP